MLDFPEFGETTVALMDIDPDRLRDTERVAHRLAERLGVRPQIVATTDRRRALDGADAVLTMFQVGGYRPATAVDFELPKRHGLRQTIGDTLGIGGIMRGLRTVPVLLELAREMEGLCPEALLLNHVNPMAISTWAGSRASRIRVVGLCHSVQGTATYLGLLLGVEPDELEYLCAGINHLAFYLRFAHRGVDLYPALRNLVREGRVPPHDGVRFTVLELLGYFATESSEHFAEYVPWFIKRDRPDLIERYGTRSTNVRGVARRRSRNGRRCERQSRQRIRWLGSGTRRLVGRRSSGVYKNPGWSGMRRGCVAGGKRRHEQGGRCTQGSMQR